MAELKTDCPSTALVAALPVGKLDKIKLKQTERQFVPTIRVKLDNSKILYVPIDPEANRNSSILLAEITRNFVKDQFEKWDENDRILTPAELKDAMTAAKLANEMSIVAHENILPPPDQIGKAGKGAAGAMLQGVKAMAEGLAKGTADAQQEAVRKFLEAGKKVRQADAIDVTVEAK
jgi:hypothetical protein